MARPASPTVNLAPERVLEWAKQTALVIAASLFVAVCAHITIPLPFTPVPLTVQNFAVLLVGLLLGSRRGFAALALYLAEGAMGLPVFSPIGVGGIAHLLGPTGGYLLAYPFVAAVAGFLFERGVKNFVRAAIAGSLAEVLLFAGGLAWLYVYTHSLATAAYLGLYWFLAAEVMKVMFAAAIAVRWNRRAGNLA
jgi:biotin transport system substrate-specific component